MGKTLSYLARIWKRKLNLITISVIEVLQVQFSAWSDNGRPY